MSWIGLAILAFLMFVIIYCIAVIGHIPDYYDPSTSDINLNIFVIPFFFCLLFQRGIIILQSVLLLPWLFNKKYRYKFVFISLLVQISFYCITEFTIIERVVLWVIDSR
jgi:hypothetical protein